MGDLVFKESKWEEAIKEYDEAISVQETGELDLKEGKCYEKLRNFEMAIEKYKRSGELNDGALPHFRLGWAYIRQGEKEKGIVELRLSLKIEPKNPEVLTKLGEVLLRENETLEEAIKSIEQALEISPNLPDALVAMGRALERKGDSDAAIPYYTKAIQQPVTNINAYFYLAVIYEKNKDYKKSIQLFKQCLCKSVYIVYILYIYGICSLGQGTFRCLSPFSDSIGECAGDSKSVKVLQTCAEAGPPKRSSKFWVWEDPSLIFEQRGHPSEAL